MRKVERLHKLIDFRNGCGNFGKFVVAVPEYAAKAQGKFAGGAEVEVARSGEKGRIGFGRF